MSPIACSSCIRRTHNGDFSLTRKPDKKQRNLLFIPPGTEMFHFPGCAPAQLFIYLTFRYNNVTIYADTKPLKTGVAPCSHGSPKKFSSVSQVFSWELYLLRGFSSLPRFHASRPPPASVTRQRPLLYLEPNTQKAGQVTAVSSGVSPFGNFRITDCLASPRNVSRPYHVLHRFLKPRHPPYALNIPVRNVRNCFLYV